VTVVVVFAPVFPPATKGGGPIRTLGSLVRAVPEGFDVSVLTSDREIRTGERLPVESGRWLRWNDADIQYLATGRPISLLRGYASSRRAAPRILYFNSFFNPSLSIVPQVLALLGFWGRPLRLLAPRGEFGSEALTRHRGRKRVYLAAYRLLGLHRGLYWHASTETEADDIRRVWGRGARVLVRENETGLPAEALAAVSPPASAPTRLVFLGRLTDLKGLAIALEALRSVASPIDFDVYGPEEDRAYVARCREIAASLPATKTVRFLGVVEPDQVPGVLARYDLTVFPTAGENFGQVIAESLSASTPVMASPATPWTDVLAGGGGVVVPDRSVAAWADAVAAYAGSSAVERGRRKVNAGAAYERWRSKEAAPHIFQLLVATAPPSVGRGHR